MYRVLTIVMMLCVGAALAFPKVPKCASTIARTIRREEVFSTILSAEGEDFYDDFAQVSLTLDPNEEALLTITTEPLRRYYRALSKRQDGNSRGWDYVRYKGTTRRERKKQRRKQKRRKKDPCKAGGGCTEGQSMPNKGTEFLVRIMDGSVSQNLVSALESRGEKLHVFVRGQQGDCANPATIELQGIKGTQTIKIDSTVSRRQGWNRAALNFADAVNVGLENKDEPSDWCGQVNAILPTAQEATDPSCGAETTNPKWKVWLNPNDELQVTARFKSLQDGTEPATRAELRLYQTPNSESEATVIVEASLGSGAEKTKRGSFVHRQATSGCFNLELSRSNQRMPSVEHSHEYAVGFQVHRNCADAPGGTFVLPQHQKTCGWLAQQAPKTILDICTPSSKSNAHIYCQKTCELCPNCSESPTTRISVRENTCKSLRRRKSRLLAAGKLELYCREDVAGTVCPATCDKCPAVTDAAC